MPALASQLTPLFPKSYFGSGPVFLGRFKKLIFTKRFYEPAVASQNESRAINGPKASESPCGLSARDPIFLKE